MSHQLHDRISQEIARRIAADLANRPEWLALARGNLDRWTELNHDSPSLLRCYQEWRAILERPLHEIAAALTATTDEGQRLRQNSPFAGALPPATIWEIKRRFRDEQTAA
jgi:hypothetical protein